MSLFNSIKVSVRLNTIWLVGAIEYWLSFYNIERDEKKEKKSLETNDSEVSQRPLDDDTERVQLVKN